MNEELVSHEIEIHEKRLNSHSERLDKIEQAQAEFKIHIQSLCEDIKNLTGSLKVALWTSWNLLYRVLFLYDSTLHSKIERR